MLLENVMLKYSKKNMVSWLASSFIILISIGAYFQINNYIVAVFLLISGFLFIINGRLIMSNIKRNFRVKIWLIYTLLELSSSIFHGRLFMDKAFFVDLSFLIIALAMTSCIDRKDFCQNFVRVMIVFSILVLITQLIQVDLFAGLKAGTMYSSIDSSTGGVSAIFEYRHYYGILLSCAFFMNAYYGKEKYKFLIGCILISNIILTYTRSIWLAFALGVMMYGWKERQKIKGRKLLLIMLIVLILFMSMLFFPEVIVSVIDKIIARYHDAKVVSTYLYGGVRGYAIICGTQYIFEHWKEYLFWGGGNGFAMTWLQENPYGTYKEWTAAIDVQYVSVLMNTGIIGLSFVVMLIVKEIRVYLLNERNSNFLIAVLILIMSIAFGFFDVFGTCTSIYAFWIFILCLQDEKVSTSKSSSY
jgi:hypothetical protein